MASLNFGLITVTQILLIFGVFYNTLKAAFVEVSEWRCLLSTLNCVVAWIIFKIIWPGF